MISNMKDRDLRRAISRSLANCCADTGPSGGEAKKAARPPSGGLPERPNRAEDVGRVQAGEKPWMDNDLCRIIGFISLSKGSNSKVDARKRQVKR